MLLLLILAAAPTRVFIDAGHGLSDNSGTTSVFCETESEVNLRVAAGLTQRLRTAGLLVEMSRTASVGPSYEDRIARAAELGSDLLLSVHTDARGTPQDHYGCPRRDTEAGFAILYSDEGKPAARRQLARSIAKAMAARGFTPYDGRDYGAMYQKDSVPGVFIDRRGLFMLRRPKMASVIVETHHAWHFVEATAWRTDATLDRFAGAIRDAIEPGDPRPPQR